MNNTLLFRDNKILEKWQKYIIYIIVYTIDYAVGKGNLDEIVNSKDGEGLAKMAEEILKEQQQGQGKEGSEKAKMHNKVISCAQQSSFPTTTYSSMQNFNQEVANTVKEIGFGVKELKVKVISQTKQHLPYAILRYCFSSFGIFN